MMRRDSSPASPVRVGLIGAGKFGSMFLAQVPTTPAIEIAAIADLDPARARRACEAVGWDAPRIAGTAFLEDGAAMAREIDLDVVIEATGSPLAGIRHARAAIAARRHVVMVNVEADALVGPLLAAEARAAGVVISMAYGDQPALVAELVEWARDCGFPVVAAGKGTKYLPGYHELTPDRVWDHYGITAEGARAAGMNSQMFTSFMDGTKSAIEMAAIANSCGLDAPAMGLAFPPCGVDDLPHVLRPREDGGILDAKGMVEVVACDERDGRPVFRDLRWGVYVVVEAPNPYSAACFAQYGVKTDRTGRYAALYRPCHLIGLELGRSVLRAARDGRPIGSVTEFRADVMAVAKRDLKPGDRLDGEGGYAAYGRVAPAARAMAEGALPIGLAHDAVVRHPIARGEVIRWDAVEIDTTRADVVARREMEARFAPVG
ncbi:SAF domain-containing protein [Limibaculum sp. FT325]|uniref:NAD(P)H-dependent oxidoreductase n=1 Tax=Thermohalobaculum sediminis TaxID=2939436 RepID=UPI0020BFDB87|nr:SAF domain-containing protein [Limibaculum sediminis]MCL5778761.1 SAF domain-containing protein [Limibaculum sediminis]